MFKQLHVLTMTNYNLAINVTPNLNPNFLTSYFIQSFHIAQHRTAHGEVAFIHLHVHQQCSPLMKLDSILYRKFY